MTRKQYLGHEPGHWLPWGAYGTRPGGGIVLSAEGHRLAARLAGEASEYYGIAARRPAHHADADRLRRRQAADDAQRMVAYRLLRR